ncbi:MAG TPA: MarR family transcriptional regulator [Methylomusa anaerophila]|uniref:Transcriptional regulator SlyA n=1 Tax=Methylomusa anaerophila TaxID=1930071 RepID=A0A348AG68_9FIRM|nr:MarR family transcriptional regulator [Methylomusa anaerophila]BBB90066.1 transcriptional regulator SlyA [Methylomusa anaerophila]HML88208.1 MarR family transcriptional regulator [Methylomusa anaerophila]
MHRTGQFFFDKHFEEWGIGSGHFSFLLCLYRQEGISQDVISKRLHVDKATTARAIAKLETLGYIIREEDPTDRRAYLIKLTPQGKQLEPKIKDVLKAWAGLITEDLSPEEQDLAYQLLSNMAEKALAVKKLCYGPKADNNA